MSEFFIEIVFLTCEYLKEPQGIDNAAPRFAWKYKSNMENGKQTEYKISVWAENGCMWDSGWVLSAKQHNIVYGGKKLQPKTKYFWKVFSKSNLTEEIAESETAAFETGFLNSKWQGSWIGSPDFNNNIPYFKKRFFLKDNVKKARAYICGLGYYELLINGEKVGDSILDPAWTNYDKKALYASYTADRLLNKGENAVGVILGNGYFKTEYHATANRILQFILQLEVLYENGETETIVSDMDGWRSSTNGALRTAGVYDGEVYDANRRLVGFSETSFCERASDNWKNVVITAPPCEKLTAQNMEPIRITEEICAAEIHIINPQTYVVDFGQNMAGFINLNVCGEKNTEIIMKYAELLYDDNRVNMENIRAAKATDVYILNGEGNESYRPRFTYHGFRYVQIEVNGRINSFSSENIMALRIHSDVEKSGEFSCSDEFINRLQRCCVNTERSNLHGLPTDCPQRDERMGWLNDMTVRAEEAIYNYKLVNVYEKWMQDILEKQDSLGAVCDTAPQSRFGRFPADPVCCSLILVPWLCFLHYGDRKILRDCYSGMKKWAGYLDSISENNIIAFTSYGDWASPIGQGEKGSCGSAVSAATPGSLVSTAFFYLSAKLISKIAGILDEKSDQAQYSEKAAEIYGAFQKEFYSREHGCYGFIKEIGGSQASQAIALRFSLVPAEHKSAVLKYLVNDIKNKNDFHFTTGNICTKYLIEVLAENGEVETAMALLKQTTYPGFGYMLSMGATTIWERWEHATTGFLAEMGSHNHPMYASIGSWFYCALAGIRLNENSEGFEIFEIRPFFPNGMQFAEARINTIKGDLFCRWDRNNKKVTLKLQVPYNSRAILLLPNTERRTISSGEHNIQFEIY